MKIESVNTTPEYSSKSTKWLEYRINGVTIASSSVFMMNGIYTKGKLGRTFDWHFEGIKQLFGEKYEAHRELFNWKNPGLVYGTGGTIPLKKVKEIIKTVAGI